MIRYNKNIISTWDRDSIVHVSNLVENITEYLNDNDINEITLLDIGSNTGAFTALLSKNNVISNALLIEAEPELHRFSRDKLGERYLYENVALGSYHHHAYFLPSVVGSASLLNLGTGRVTEHPSSEARNVEVFTFDFLWKTKYRDFKPNVIKIDAEGSDIEILVGMKEFLSSLDYKPLIIYEFGGHEGMDKTLNLSNEAKLGFLQTMGYFPIWSNSIVPPYSCDVALATTSRKKYNLVDDMQKNKIGASSKQNDLTIVTGLFDLGRENLNNGFERSFEHYIESFKLLLNVELPMVIYTTSDIADNIIWKIRKYDNTKVIIKTLEDFNSFPFKSQIDEIRNNVEWSTQADWLKNSPQSTLEYYNPLVMSKHFWLNDSSHFNYFDSKYFLWVDAGISNTIGNPVESMNKEFATKLISEMSKMVYVCFPYDGTNEVHGFKKESMDEIAGTETTYVARGGIFGGSKYYINEVNSAYYELLHNTLNQGLMGTEESIFTILSYTHPHLIKTHMIDSNGLVIKFLNDINSIEIEKIENPLCIYALTFNLPEQFEIWAKNFESYSLDSMYNLTKYVINNSTDDSVRDEYDILFKRYGFIEYKFDNIGICDGRQFAAEHFAKSNHKYMIFFEDDMLIHDIPSICKNGFNTYVPDVFEKSINILENENLDFLKLSFSEFYGDNHEDWASYNVSPEKSKKYYPYRSDAVSHRKANIDYTGSYDGVSYSIGNHHYCNWPILFNKKGNFLVFLDVIYEHKYEHTWMNYVADKQHDGTLKVGCLLASPINHNRVFHYGNDSRRENRHYTN